MLSFQWVSSSSTRSASRDTVSRMKAATDWPRIADASLRRRAVASGKRGLILTTLVRTGARVADFNEVVMQ